MVLRRLYNDEKKTYFEQFEGKLSKQTIKTLLYLNCLHDSRIRQIKIDYKNFELLTQKVDVWIYFKAWRNDLFYSMRFIKVHELQMDLNYRTQVDSGNWIVEVDLGVVEDELVIELILRDWAEVESKILIKADRMIISRDHEDMI